MAIQWVVAVKGTGHHIASVAHSGEDWDEEDDLYISRIQCLCGG